MLNILTLKQNKNKTKTRVSSRTKTGKVSKCTVLTHLFYTFHNPSGHNATQMIG